MSGFPNCSAANDGGMKQDDRTEDIRDRGQIDIRMVKGKLTTCITKSLSQRIILFEAGGL